MLRHRRWAGDHEIAGHHVSLHPGGKYVHPHNAGAGGSYLKDEERLVFWEGRADFNRIAVKALVHPTHGDYSFLLAHGVQSTKFAQALTCSPTTGIRRCIASGSNPAVYPEGTELVYSKDSVASDASFDVNSATAMGEATGRIGFTLLYNDATRPGWPVYDDDGSFLLKHKTKPMIVVPERGGGYSDQIQNGYKLIWKACPTDCANDFTRDEYMTYGFIFEDFNGAVCLPPGV